MGERNLLLASAVFVIHIALIATITVDEDALNTLPQAIRQSPSSLVRIINSSFTLPEEALANMSSTLSNTSFADIENDNLTQSLQLRYRERRKQERIIVIQAQILGRLGMNRQPNISASIFSEDDQKKIAMLLERMQSANNGYMELAGSANSFLAKLQSFYPSCSLPNNTDKSLWDMNESFRIYYDPPLSKQVPEISIMLAKLRLYKVTGNADPNFIGWNTNTETLPRYNQLESLINPRAANGINVSIFQFLKPLRANKRGRAIPERKRLVDSRTIAVDYQGWVEFNVISSLNYWLQNTNKNFGFDVEVEDAYGNRLNPNLYFQNINCSGEIPQDPPFPNIMELHPEMGENESSLFDNETYPTLDLQTAEVPRDFHESDLLAEGFSDRAIRKRSAQDSEEEENPCRGEEEYVTFAEMGLDSFILHPQGVMWTFCEGNCSSSTLIEDRKQSFYSIWMQRLFGNQWEPISSCTVTSRESLSIVFYDGENTVLETVVDDVIPTSCGCRKT